MPPTIHARYTSLAEPAACIISAGTRKIPLPMTIPMTIDAAWAAPSSRTRPGATVLFSTVEGILQEYSVFPHSELRVAVLRNHTSPVHLPYRQGKASAARRQ